MTQAVRITSNYYLPTLIEQFLGMTSTFIKTHLWVSLGGVSGTDLAKTILSQNALTQFDYGALRYLGKSATSVMDGDNLNTIPTFLYLETFYLRHDLENRAIALYNQEIEKESGANALIFQVCLPYIDINEGDFVYPCNYNASTIELFLSRYSETYQNSKELLENVLKTELLHLQNDSIPDIIKVCIKHLPDSFRTIINSALQEASAKQSPWLEKLLEPQT